MENEKIIEPQATEEFIEKHIPFIISCISKFTGRYVSIENDDEYSIGMMAFVEAIEKYKESRGDFYAFSRLVIESRLKNFFEKENKHIKNKSIEDYKERGTDLVDNLEDHNKDDLNREFTINEIKKLKEEIDDFGFGFEELVNEAPKHKDTREKAIDISEKSSREKDITDFMFVKKRLPIKNISDRFDVSEKVIRKSKLFIITVIIILFRGYRNLKLWIKKGR
ncbi:sigma factor [Peptacetobacter hiranonis]|uniref:sigma factor n=1 Tax=Peptacetobacter hiranonis TaxID=89152 RepID=UPI002E765B8E|nr:sigma factor [Peptacetobacter hiranonis]MEE0248469.1 sigma factor [Peptacetobacter hiranonis]